MGAKGWSETGEGAQSPSLGAGVADPIFPMGYCDRGPEREGSVAKAKAARKTRASRGAAQFT